MSFRYLLDIFMSIHYLLDTYATLSLHLLVEFTVSNGRYLEAGAVPRARHVPRTLADARVAGGWTDAGDVSGTSGKRGERQLLHESNCGDKNHICERCTH